ncbi:MAG: 30S ribosomal protein S7 [archaeon]
MEKTNLKLFDKWDEKDVKVNDVSLSKYLNLQNKRIPHSFGKHAKKRFEKSEVSIVERLVNKLMRSGQGKRKLSGKYIRGRGNTGKKLKAMKIVETTFEKIEKQTKQNPLQVLVKAIEHSAPREDTTRLKKGGISYTLSVDVSPQKRVDEAIKNLSLAAFASSFNNKTAVSDALAKELILASKEDAQSFSVKRRDEIERIAKSSR